jgi:hypothetical protein
VSPRQKTLVLVVAGAAASYLLGYADAPWWSLLGVLLVWALAMWSWVL